MEYQAEIRIAKYEFESSKYKLSSKKYWSLLNSVYQNSDSIESVPPLNVNGIKVTHSDDKTDFFYDIIISQQLIDDSSVNFT